MDAKTLLVAALVDHCRCRSSPSGTPPSAPASGPGTPASRCSRTPLRSGIGFVTNFFDTLGIGSYATTTSMFKAWKVIPDEKIPGTLNVGHALPTVVQARHLHAPSSRSSS